MICSLRGKVSEISSRFLVVENNGIGYEVLVAKPNDFLLGSDVKLNIYHHIREDDEYLVGFITPKEKEAFKLLLHVNGIGPKSALSILSRINYDELLIAISNNNLELIESIPGISSHVASQILLDLKEYIARTNRENVVQYKEVKEALKALKFKVKEIDPVLSNIYIPNGTNEEILKEALRRLQDVKNNRQESAN